MTSLVERTETPKEGGGEKVDHFLKDSIDFINSGNIFQT